MDLTVAYFPNGNYYIGYYGTTNDWDNYLRYVNPDGVQMSHLITIGSDLYMEYMGIWIMVMVMHHTVLIHMLAHFCDSRSALWSFRGIFFPVYVRLLRDNEYKVRIAAILIM
ncbi:hypothetical protein HanPI659440_Chr03g0112221 [Helianthus annuus]|nr:hypothetical protein HanPI659440_Chr03g0112221 [Helianthus annuus]